MLQFGGCGASRHLSTSTMRGELLDKKGPLSPGLAHPSQSHALRPKSQGKKRHDACFSECPKYMMVDTGTVMRWRTDCT